MFQSANLFFKNLHKHNKTIAISTIFSALVIVFICSFLITQNVAFTKAVVDNSVLGINDDLTKEEMFWIDFLSKNPGYFSGYIRLIQIEKALGNDAAAYLYFQHAYEINPNSEELKSLK